jgi:serine/threonine protein kinase
MDGTNNGVEISIKKSNPKKLNLKNFEMGEILGTGKSKYIRLILPIGSFAKVRIAQNNATKKYYAVKVLKKEEVIQLQQVDHIINEMRILNYVDHQFIVII